MRNVPAIWIAAALAIAAPAQAAPNSINDCEKIEAADAYNQCLASFGPVAHTRAASAKDFGGDGAAADVADAAPPPMVSARGRHGSHGRYAHASRGRHHEHYAQGSGRHRGKASAGSRHGGSKRLAFNVVSGHSRKR